MSILYKNHKLQLFNMNSYLIEELLTLAMLNHINRK